jgi:Ni,Fe-hydrogenase III small subunit
VCYYQRRFNSCRVVVGCGSCAAGGGIAVAAATAVALLVIVAAVTSVAVAVACAPSGNLSLKEFRQRSGNGFAAREKSVINCVN